MRCGGRHNLHQLIPAEPTMEKLWKIDQLYNIPTPVYQIFFIHFQSILKKLWIFQNSFDYIAAYGRTLQSFNFFYGETDCAKFLKKSPVVQSHLGSSLHFSQPFTINNQQAVNFPKLTRLTLALTRNSASFISISDRLYKAKILEKILIIESLVNNWPDFSHKFTTSCQRAVNFQKNRKNKSKLTRHSPSKFTSNFSKWISRERERDKKNYEKS